MSVSWSIDVHDSVESTQTLIKEMGEAGQPEGAVVQALEQTGGYGRHDREWISAPGNLYLSFLLRPKCSVQEIGQLSLMAGLAVGRAIQPFLDVPDSLQLKWPNDVLLDDKKCAGLILEAELGAGQALNWVALGIGINVKAAPEMGTSIAGHSAAPPGINRLSDSLLKAVNALYTQWQDQGFDAIKQDWLALAHQKGARMSVKIGEDERQGKFYGIDDHGALLMSDEQLRVQKITSGDVYL